MRYRLRTLMIVMAVVPVLLAAIIANLLSRAYSQRISHGVFPNGAAMRDFDPPDDDGPPSDDPNRPEPHSRQP